MSYCHSTVIYCYTLCPISGHACHTLWIHQISEYMRCPGRQFRRRLKLLTMGYTACSVNGTLPVCSGFSMQILYQLVCTLLLHYLNYLMHDLWRFLKETLNINQSINRSVNQSILSINQPIAQYINRSTNQSTKQSINQLQTKYLLLWKSILDTGILCGYLYPNISYLFL